MKKPIYQWVGEQGELGLHKEIVEANINLEYF
jgi:hypothetical protein